MEGQIKVLFICVHNSGRSQIAETLLWNLARDKFYVESAGLEPKPINPLVIEVMKELGFDLSKKHSKSVFDFYKQGRLYDYVISLCDDYNEKKCPVFPGIVKRYHWPFFDPEMLTGNDKEKKAALRNIVNQIKNKLESWIKEF